MALHSTDLRSPMTPASISMKAQGPQLLPLHRDNLLDLPSLAPHRDSSAAASSSPLDGHLVAHPLHLDLYNPMQQQSVTPQKSQHTIDSNSHSQRAVVESTDTSRTSRFYRLNSHQKQSSTASLAEFLKTTGPEDIRKGPFAGMSRPVSPNSNRKKSPGSFLLKFAVGKSNSTSPKRDDGTEIAMTEGKSRELPPPPLAKEQFTAAGRKYYAIKVDYPFDDESLSSARPLLSSSQLDPNADTRSELDYHAIMSMKKHHRLSSVLASDTSMEFLVDDNNTVTPRSSGRYSSYPPSRSRYSLVRSNSLSEIASDSIRDDGSILPGDSVSLRPVQRKRMNSSPGSVQSTSAPLRNAAKHGLSLAAVRSGSPTASFATTVQESSVAARTLASSPIPPPSQASNTMELMASLDMLDRLRKSRAPSDADSTISHATTKSLQQRRRAKRLAQSSGSLDVTKRDTPKHAIHSSRSIPSDLNNKGLPMLPPHTNGNTTSVQRERAAAVAAALSPRQKKKSSPEPSSPTSRRVLSPTFSNISLENYAIPEDDVLSLRSGISAYRSQRREKVRDKRHKDLEDERSRKLDEAMKLLQKDVQKKKELLDQQEALQSNQSSTVTSGGSQTPRQMPSIERLRTPPSTPPPPNPGYTVSPILIVADYPPDGPRRQHASKPSENTDYRPPTSNSQRTVFTNGPITPVSSAPSSPTKAQYHSIAKQPIPQLVSLPPNYPPPQPSPLQRAKLDDREQRIAALEEQKWVLEQALRVLLNQTTTGSSASSSPRMGFAGSPGN